LTLKRVKLGGYREKTAYSGALRRKTQSAPDQGGRGKGELIFDRIRSPRRQVPLADLVQKRGR